MEEKRSRKKREDQKSRDKGFIFRRISEEFSKRKRKRERKKKKKRRENKRKRKEKKKKKKRKTIGKGDTRLFSVNGVQSTLVTDVGFRDQTDLAPQETNGGVLRHTLYSSPGAD